LERRKRYLKVGDLREGVVLRSDGNCSIVEIGIEHPIKIPVPDLAPNSRITVKIKKIGKDLEAEMIEPKTIKDYRGFKVKIISLKRALKMHEKSTKIGTSKLGNPYFNEKEAITQAIKSKKSIILFLGSPKTGIHEIFNAQGLDASKILDFLINVIPNQGTRTVRTEEALFISLSLLNCLAS
ncbi:MAG: putative RNA uridine N3 methyltransferase, partial [Candidatus Helarchaeales archaeon]